MYEIVASSLCKFNEIRAYRSIFLENRAYLCYIIGGNNMESGELQNGYNRKERTPNEEHR